MFLWSPTLETLFSIQRAAPVLPRLSPNSGAGRWITIDTSRVALALARARLMGAKYPFFLLADSTDGQQKEAEVSRTVPASKSTRGDIRQGFVYERVPHVTLKSIANNSEIDVIWDTWQQKLEPLREELNAALANSWQEWEIPRQADVTWPDDVKALHADWWTARIARQAEVDKSIAAKAEFEYLYDRPYEDKKKVRVAGPFTVESLSPHRMLGLDENDDIIDTINDGSVGRNLTQTFPQMILENLRIAGVQQAHKDDRIVFTELAPWPGNMICGAGKFNTDQWPSASGQLPVAGGHASSLYSANTDQRSPDSTERRAAIFIGSEFATVQRADLVSAAREAADSGFDVLISCAFNYEAHTTELIKLGRIPILKARMNADLHMSADLKNTGKGNLFVIFGEPDITVTSGQWIVARNGRMISNFAYLKELSGFGSLAEINSAGRDGLSAVGTLSSRGALRDYEPDTEGGGVGGSEHRGGGGAGRDEGVSAVSGDSERVTGGDGDHDGADRTPRTGTQPGDRANSGGGGRSREDAERAKTLSSLQALSDADFPLSLTTDHWSQVTVHGVDVFKPQTGEVISDTAEGIACWFIDTDYNEESFFVRHAYFLGANDPYSALKTTLKAEINKEAWDTLNSDVSRPFEQPTNGRIAVKVINHLGDEVMKVFKV